MKNFLLAIYYGVLIGTLLLMCMFILGVISQFINANAVRSLIPVDQNYFFSGWTWVACAIAAVLFSRRALRSVIG